MVDDRALTKAQRTYEKAVKRKEDDENVIHLITLTVTCFVIIALVFWWLK